MDFALDMRRMAPRVQLEVDAEVAELVRVVGVRSSKEGLGLRA